MLLLEDAPSPNFNERARPPSLVLLHYTGMKTGAEALARLRDPDAKVSAHYLVEEDGRVFRLVAEEKRAWHAGVSFWRGERDVNGASIGVEIVNPGHDWGYRPFAEAQVQAVIALLQDIRARRPGIFPKGVIGHSDVAPSRKMDPGELFPWARLAEEGLAIGPHAGAAREVSERDAIRALIAIGYEAKLETLDADINAFQRRFRPDALGAGLDAVTRTAAVEVAARFVAQ